MATVDITASTAFHKAHEKVEGLLNVASGEATTVRRFVEIATQAVGSPIASLMGRSWPVQRIAR